MWVFLIYGFTKNNEVDCFIHISVYTCAINSFQPINEFILLYPSYKWVQCSWEVPDAKTTRAKQPIEQQICHNICLLNRRYSIRYLYFGWLNSKTSPVYKVDLNIFLTKTWIVGGCDYQTKLKSSFSHP